jgi:hypothetical protein
MGHLLKSHVTSPEKTLYIFISSTKGTTMKLFNLVAKMFLGLMLLTSTAMAEPIKLDLNQESSLDVMAEAMKEIFKTDEDQRMISYDLVKLRKLTEKWLWRFEAKGQQIDFRVNGRVQISLKFDEVEPQKFVHINGLKVEYAKPGLSYKSFMSQIEKALARNQAHLFRGLFIQEAHAFFGVLAGFGAGWLVGQAMCRDGRLDPNCDYCRRLRGERTRGSSLTSSSGSSRRAARRGRPRCSYTGITARLDNPRETFMINNGQARQVATNFIRGLNRSCPHEGRCFENVDDCVRWKTLMPQNRWNKTLPSNQRRARALVRTVCEHVYNQVLTCHGGGSYTPPSHSAPSEPTYDDEYSIPLPACNKSGQDRINACNRGETECCDDASGSGVSY